MALIVEQGQGFRGMGSRYRMGGLPFAPTMPQGRPAYWCHAGGPLSAALPEQLAIGAHFGFEIGRQVGRSGAGFSD